MPPGHTAFSWGSGSADGKVAVLRGAQGSAAPAPAAVATAPSTAPAAAPAPSAAPKQQKASGKQASGKKASGKKEAAAAPAAASSASDFYALDIRVGRIVKAYDHPKADRLFVEEIDLGEESPRQICSGLKGLIPLQKVQGTRCLVVANLQPNDMLGVMSYGMVLCAASADRKQIEFVEPPINASVGARVYLEGDSSEDLYKYPAEENIKAKDKKSSWAKIAPELRTNGDRVATYKGQALRVRAGVLAAPTLANMQIS